jgi:hypothetical protein
VAEDGEYLKNFSQRPRPIERSMEAILALQAQRKEEPGKTFEKSVLAVFNLVSIVDMDDAGSKVSTTGG